MFLFLFFVASAGANEIKLYNNCPFTVWPGIQGNPGKGQPDGGGFSLAAYQARSIYVAGDWAGRIWARTSCESGRCATGDCGNRIECDGAGGVPPVSLAEITLSGYGGVDFYDISLVDGYNLPIKMFPISGYAGRGAGRYDCTPAGCQADLNAICPAELAVKSGGWTVACLSACMKFNTDEYCCRNAHGTPQTCRSTDWPVNYPAVFKRACPDAYSYAYDDTTSTFTCKGNPAANYQVTFCP
ncbi:Thaumatin family [Nesidiocoris tenuis]|uniref:Thaumatin family n=1 Tax=Nesidiocoris tenuis TaxID=355587 RepID=A0ABN7B3Q1_9HEMI|nr:Thaumatin family [Nesidiocoris tenuis]